MNYKKFLMANRKSSLHLVMLSAVLGLEIAIFLYLPTQAQSQSITQPNRNRLQRSVTVGFKSPRRNGEPKQSTTTGTRGACLQDKAQSPFLTPLVPETQQGLTEKEEENVSEHPTLTVSEHPTFFVYIPPSSAKMAQFVLTDANNTEEIYYTKFALPDTPGIISIKVPSDRPPLEIGKVYKWTVSIKCNAVGNDGNPKVLGWVQRIEPNPTLKKALEDKKTPLERAALYGENGIWHELLTTLADINNSESEVATIWKNLLNSEPVKLKPIAKAPLLECCTPKN
jgi:hypothetical protein